MKRILRKNFFMTLFVKQNKWHKHSVLGHTLRLVQECIKAKRYDFILAGLLHDIAKPLSAIQDSKDKLQGTYSFPNHEELGYQIIKNWWVSDKTKTLVRYHYLLRGYEKSLEKGLIGKANRYKRIINKLDDNLMKDLELFQKLDDIAKD